LVAKQKEKINPENLAPRLKVKYNDEVVPEMMKEFNFTNKLMVPKILKTTVNVGLGEALASSNVIQIVTRDLQLITGQKPIERKAKKSIANFKLREEQVIGLSVTLRSKNMWFFLDRLLNIALPRVRDFRGVSDKAFDGNGNYSLGLQEQVIFPEIDYNEIDKLRGMQINIVTSKNSNDESKKLLELLGMPFTKKS
jgi:large subunit ribosomal protein L5|tara:strand:- start:634 stop:1221 length:588 start_codon:yes stop_codon:yes gene_type:complete